MDDYCFDITTALHDDIKFGGDYPRTRSRIVLSRWAYPTYGKAAEVAACLAVAVHGGMAIEILPRY